MSRITDIAKTMKTWWNEDDDPFVHRALDEIIRIDQEQSLTIEPKCGKWIETCDNSRLCSIIRDSCSNCGEEWLPEFTKRFNFCPNCGADIKGADDETEMS